MKLYARRCVRRVYFKIMRNKMLSIKSSVFILTSLLSVSLIGCSSDGEERPDYLDATTVKNLEVPPKLSVPDTRGALRLPEPSDNAKSGVAASKVSPVIAPNFKGYELKHDSRLYWLEIDKPLAEVWKMLPDFLAAEGINISRAEKLLGFVDTIWMDEYQASYDTEKSTSWFGGFSPDYKDRFRIRLEAVDGENKTRLFVAHRGLQISVAYDVSAWVQRDSEPFMEREIMYRFVLFAGINKADSKQLFAAYNSYQPRVKRLLDIADDIEVKGDADTVWLRLKLSMDRLGVDILKQDKTSRELTVLVGNLNIDIKPEKDESGWFGGLFSGKDIVVDDEDDGYENTEFKKQPDKVAPEDRITLQIKQIVGDESSKIKISNEDGSVNSSKLAGLFKDSLLEQLK